MQAVPAHRLAGVPARQEQPNGSTRGISDGAQNYVQSCIVAPTGRSIPLAQVSAYDMDDSAENSAVIGTCNATRFGQQVPDAFSALEPELKQLRHGHSPAATDS